MVVLFFHEVPHHRRPSSPHGHTIKVAYASKEKSVTFYCEPLNYLLDIYATGYIITEIYTDMTRFTQPSSNFPTEYAKVFWNIVLGCDRAYDKYVLKGIIMK